MLHLVSGFLLHFHHLILGAIMRYKCVCIYTYMLCILYSIVNRTCGFIADIRVSTEAATLYSVSWLVKPILTSRQKSVVTQKFTTRTSILKATFVLTFWGLLSNAVGRFDFERNCRTSKFSPRVDGMFTQYSLYTGAKQFWT